MRYPQGALFLFLEARLLQVTGKVDEVAVTVAIFETVVCVK